MCLVGEKDRADPLPAMFSLSEAPASVISGEKVHYYSLPTPDLRKQDSYGSGTFGPFFGVYCRNIILILVGRIAWNQEHISKSLLSRLYNVVSKPNHSHSQI